MEVNEPSYISGVYVIAIATGAVPVKKVNAEDAFVE